jgi:hypothetical protein
MSATLLRAHRTRRWEVWYVLPGDAIRVVTNDRRVLALADRLWERAVTVPAHARRAAGHLAFTIDVSGGSAPSTDALVEQWTIGRDDVELSCGEELHSRMECARGRLTGRVSLRLLVDQPSLVTRHLLETPAAVLLARRGYAVVHAGAVVGPAGAVVIRGAAGSGKSTLVAAAHRAGLSVLGDETVLAGRDDPDDLLAAVRDVTLLPSATELLGLHGAVTPTDSGTELKHRLDLFRSSRPTVRRARRLATVLLGPRTDGPARLESLDAETFLADFGHGHIPQERWSGTPEHIAVHWSKHGAYRLRGALDLSGAVDLLARLVAGPALARRA